MHNGFTEDVFLNFSGPGKLVAMLYIRWKLDREIETFKLKMNELLAKIESNMLNQTPVLVAQG